jgi:predicted nuclease with TOPRIM domain
MSEIEHDTDLPFSDAALLQEQETETEAGTGTEKKLSLSELNAAFKNVLSEVEDLKKQVSELHRKNVDKSEIITLQKQIIALLKRD